MTCGEIKEPAPTGDAARDRVPEQEGMTSEARRILEEVLSLPDEERRLIAIALCDSLATVMPSK